MADGGTSAPAPPDGAASLTLEHLVAEKPQPAPKDGDDQVATDGEAGPESAPRWSPGRARPKPHPERPLPGSTMESLARPSPLGFLFPTSAARSPSGPSTLPDLPVGGLRFDLGAGVPDSAAASGAEMATWPLLPAARMRETGESPMPGLPAGSSLDGLAQVQVLPRGPQRPGPVEPEPLGGPASREPEPLVVELQHSTLSAAQRALKLREAGNVVEHRLDCRHHVFVRIRLVRQRYDFPDNPRRSAILAEQPADLLPRSCLDPGALAQLVVSRYGDHASLRSLSDLLADCGRAVSPGRLGDWMARLGRLLRPVALALRAAVLADKRAIADPTGAAVTWEDPRIAGTVRAVRAPSGVALSWVLRGGDDPLSSARIGDLEWAQAMFADGEGGTPGGRQADLRHRFLLAVRFAPVGASRGALLLEDLQVAELAEDRAAADAAYAAFAEWLAAEATRIDRPRDAYDRALVGAIRLGELIRADPAPAGGARPRSRQWMLYRFDGGPETVEVFATLVFSALRVGVRPWPWLRDLFAAHAAGEVVDPVAWTPLAWKSRR